MNTDEQPDKLSEQEVEYLFATDIVTRFANTLLNYPPIQEVDQNTTLLSYSKQLAQIINDLLPFDNIGIGIAPVVEQVQQLIAARLPDPNMQWLVSSEPRDCKCPTIVTAFFLRALAQHNNWPLDVECLILKPNPIQPVVGVRIREPKGDEQPLPLPYRDGTLYTIDFQVIGGGSEERVLPFSDADFDTKFGALRQSDLTTSMKLMDAEYQKAKEQAQ